MRKFNGAPIAATGDDIECRGRRLQVILALAVISGLERKGKLKEREDDWS